MSGGRLVVWPPLPPNAYLRDPARLLPFPLEESGCRVFSRGRHGLLAGLRASGIPAGSKILMPAYHHGSEVEAVVRSGLQPVFYDLGPTLVPDPDMLEQLASGDVRALYLIHVLGLPADPRVWRSWCDARGLLLIEDVAQGWLGAHAGIPLGALADISVYCLYKTFGLPDGAALLANRPPDPPSRRRLSTGAVHLILRHGTYFAQSSNMLARGRKVFDRRGISSSEISMGRVDLAPYPTTRWLLPRVVDRDAQRRRVNNFMELKRRLPTIGPTSFEEASPFAFPIVAASKERLLAHLADRLVVALNFWACPHPLLDESRYPEAALLRRSVVALPVHQDLGPDDLERIVQATLEVRAGLGRLFSG